MANQIELRLEVPFRMLRALSRAPWLRRMAEAPVERKKLVAVYFDTGGRELRKKGLSLRVGRSGGTYVQTVKESRDHRRQEWGEEIGGAAPDRLRARHTALKPFTGKKDWRRLRPIFETDIARIVIPVKSGGSHIDVALDHGKVRSGRKVLPVSEVELELKKGRLADLNRVAARIAKSGAALGLASKAERGYALADERLKAHVCAAPITLNAKMTAADGFRAIAFSCLHHLTANRAAILAGDPEGVHQMRVGLRRLRAAVSLFKSLIAGPDLEAVKKELKWLTEQLADARDFDVLLRDSVEPLEKDAPAGLPALEEDIEERRHAGFARAQRMVRSPRYRRAVLNIGLWLTGGDWADSDEDIRRDLRQQSLRDLARKILKERAAKVMKKLGKLDKMDDRQRHKLRIAVKKLRYAAGFFESLFGAAGRRKRFAACLEDLQSALGRLNDIRVHRTFAQKKVRGKRQLFHGAYALGVLIGEEREAVKPCLDAALRGGRTLRDLTPFWA